MISMYIIIITNNLKVLQKYIFMNRLEYKFQLTFIIFEKQAKVQFVGKYSNIQCYIYIKTVEVFTKL